MAAGEFWREGHREFTATAKLGDAGELSARDARKKAKDALGKIARGERPGEEGAPRRGEVTLREAWGRYKDAHLIRKNRGPRTVKGYQDHMDQHFADWLDRSLARLGRNPQLVTERHDKVSREAGPYAANGCMRTLRAVYPIRREFHLLSLLSGSRPEALKSARPEHLDLRRRILHLPRPKGGEKKAFDIPLSRPMMRSIVRLIRAARIIHPDQAEFWLFPADSASGRLVEHKEERDVLAKWGNELRQSYRTLAQPAGVSELDVHLLMNHSLPGVNAGYITRHRLLENHLRQQQDKISAVVMAAAARGSGDARKSVVTWLDSWRPQATMSGIADEAPALALAA